MFLFLGSQILGFVNSSLGFFEKMCILGSVKKSTSTERSLEESSKKEQRMLTLSSHLFNFEESKASELSH